MPDHSRLPQHRHRSGLEILEEFAVLQWSGIRIMAFLVSSMAFLVSSMAFLVSSMAIE
jgi:hypothetical protein